MQLKNVNQTYNEKTVRTIWDIEKRKWWVCVVDVAGAVTGTKDQKDYLKKLRKRDPELGEQWNAIIHPLPYPTAGGVQHVNFADIAGVHRILFKFKKKKSEPFKEWLENLVPPENE